MSCTRPSVIRKAPATRSTGTSDSAEDSAPNNLVPSVSPSAWPASTTRTSSPLIFLRLSTSASLAFSVSRVRSPKFWLGLLSITTAATDDSGSRSSRVNDGLASASRISASAAMRIAAPRGAPEQQQGCDHDDGGKREPEHERGNERGKRDAVLHVAALLPEPFDQRRRMHLVGLVVSGQRVHHDVDAGRGRRIRVAAARPASAAASAGRRGGSPRRRQDRSR